jgi:hypothetical protein
MIDRGYFRVFGSGSKRYVFNVSWKVLFLMV